MAARRVMRLARGPIRTCLRPASTLPGLDGSGTLLWRSYFYVPGDQVKKIDKMAVMAESVVAKGALAEDLASLPDLLVLDCEDAVAYNRKAAARECIASAFLADRFSVYRGSQLRRSVAVRVNSVQDDNDDQGNDGVTAGADLAAVLEAAVATALRTGAWPGPDFVCLPKVDNIDQLKWLSDRIRLLLRPLLTSSSPAAVQSSLCRGSGGGIGLVAYAESARAVIGLAELCRLATETPVLNERQGDQSDCDTSLVAIVFGSDDYCASMGVSRSSDNVEVAYARQLVANVARAFGLSSVDMVDIDLSNSLKVAENCRYGAQLGYSGKQLIHPAQVSLANSAFAPSAEMVAWARGLINAASKGPSVDKTALSAGAFVYKGQMIDRPTIRQAAHLVRLANRIGV